MSRITILTEAHGKPYNDIEKANAFQMVVNALSGEWGSGEWNDSNGTGFWVKQGQMWQGRIIYSALPSGFIRLPFRVVNCIVSAYQLDLTGNPLTQKYLADAHAVSFNSYAGQKVMIVVEPTKIVKE